MNDNQLSIKSAKHRSRSAPKYWVKIKDKLYARLQYKADDGKYKVKYKPISDKRTAKRIVDEMRRELETHGEETLHSDKMTFQELAEHYKKVKLIPAAYQGGVKISGKRSLSPALADFKVLVAYFGHKTIRSIKTSDLEAYKQSRLQGITSRGTPRKIATVNKELGLLRTILNFAIQNEWLIRNPFTLVKAIISTSAEVERDRILSFEEEARLLAACTSRRAHLRPLLICALDTAMRKGEMFKTRWKDVNFLVNEIYIPQTNTKTEAARTVGITPRLREELELLWEVSPKDEHGFVFGYKSSVIVAWKTACRLANIKDFRLHDCRHTATTRMIASGSPHTEVMKITGHSQLKTFLRYLNITSETANNVASRLDSYSSERQIQLSEISTAVN